MCKAFHQDGRICCSKACMYFSLFKFRFVGSHNRFPLCLRKKDGGVSGSSSHLASSLHLWWTVRTDNNSWKCCSSRAVILTTESFLLLMQCQLRAQSSQASTTDCWPHPLRFPQILKCLPYVLQITRSSKSSELCVEEHYSEIFLQFVDSETLPR